MHDDALERSTRRLRIVLLGLMIALFAVLAFVGIQPSFQQYMMWRRKLDDRQMGMGIRTVVPCSGEKERCTTCHLGADGTDLGVSPVPRVFRPHGPSIGKHDVRKIGCTVCHGGEGRALTLSVAHGAPTLGLPDPLRKAPHVQAACARCHIPGEKKGQERLLEGAKLYAGLGCPICHPLTESGAGGLDFGPDLRAAGRRSIEHLKTSLVDPAADFSGSTMPSFKLALEPAPTAFESLIVYLESLPLSKQPACAPKSVTVDARTPCAACHAGAGGNAVGRLRHRCPFLLERKEELRCAHCHAQDIPASDSECPVIRKQRDACATCH